MQLTPRQGSILERVKQSQPITAEDLAAELKVSRATIRGDLAILTMSGYLEARPRVGYTYAGREQGGEALARLLELCVREVQSVPVVVKATSSLYDAIVATFVEDTNTLFVVDEAARLLGALSQSDLLRSSIGQVDLHRMPVSVIMTRTANLVTLQPDETILSATRKLRTHGLTSLPVTKVVQTAAGQHLEVTGVISLRTINALLAEVAEIR